MKISKILSFLISIFILGVAWFFSINQPFESATLKRENIALSPRSREEMQLSLRCVGFTGSCEIPEAGLKLVMSFEGSQFAKPIPKFLNISGFGDNKGWGTQTHYFGHRVLTITNQQGIEVAKFHQRLWNTGAYADFSQLLAFDLSAKKLFISAGPWGFNSTQDIAYVLTF
ncbi:hypothetical protein DOM22_04970 [Bdellovibrio sp. ZAP7]|uniref:hypothetical protein n=1 Tax=Bdellovibrio sp. ZAP7 TaxID=2231053 RepID=UPI001158F6A3|nr:hypothetical protein [Bdellovibrio sp. ZAP7]QDK44556.1 hypothetical protein DOM22_04970 [Bdellovibrio sp. ZAP7]